MPQLPRCPVFRPDTRHQRERPTKITTYVGGIQLCPSAGREHQAGLLPVRSGQIDRVAAAAYWAVPVALAEARTNATDVDLTGVPDSASAIVESALWAEVLRLEHELNQDSRSQQHLDGSGPDLAGPASNASNADDKFHRPKHTQPISLILSTRAYKSGPASHPQRKPSEPKPR